MGSTWREKLKQSVLESLAEATQDLLGDARVLLQDLEKAGHTVSINATNDGLLVSPGPVADNLAKRVRAEKQALLELLRSAAQVWRWKAEDVCVLCSLNKSAITDFVLAPPVPGVFSIELNPELQTAILEDASKEWRQKVKALGGLVIYSPSNWEEAKAKLAEKVNEVA